jgi:hypothetical protein
MVQLEMVFCFPFDADVADIGLVLELENAI